jgi:hypothetical protein
MASRVIHSGSSAPLLFALTVLIMGCSSSSKKGGDESSEPTEAPVATVDEPIATVRPTSTLYPQVTQPTPTAAPSSSGGGSDTPADLPGSHDFANVPRYPNSWITYWDPGGNYDVCPGGPAVHDAVLAYEAKDSTASLVTNFYTDALSRQGWHIAYSYQNGDALYVYYGRGAFLCESEIQPGPARYEENIGLELGVSYRKDWSISYSSTDLAGFE